MVGRRVWLVALLAASLLGGCSAPDRQDAAAEDAFDDLGLQATATTGLVRGVVVDERIVPIADATVTLTGTDTNRSMTTDDQGRFAFTGLVPGTYFVQATSFVHEAAQTSVTVVAGDSDPPATSLQLVRRFTQDPYVQTWSFDGFIQCGYDLTFMSSLCLNDYTHFVGPYTCPECEYLLDRRSTNFEVGPGWQTQVLELDWTPTAQGTSPEMRLVVSHFPRPASHWYCSAAGAHPVQVRIEVGVVCEDQQDEPDQIPAEGLPNLHLFAAVNAADGPAAIAFSQRFTVYANQFYYAVPPAGWSFVNGDPLPF